jgi:hypothetical protein
MLLVVLLPLSGPATAQANHIGIGAMTCAEFLPAVTEDDVQVSAFVWAGGFVSGVNQATQAGLGVYYDVSAMNALSTVRAMISFCRRYPDRPVFAAVEAMLPTLPLRKSGQQGP